MHNEYLSLVLKDVICKNYVFKCLKTTGPFFYIFLRCVVVT